MRLENSTKGIPLAVRFIMICLCIPLHTTGQVQFPNEAFKSRPIVTDETYNSVLDQIFPRKWTDDRKTDWSLVLRFKPYSAPESQIVIRKLVDTVEVYEYSANQIVFNRINGWKESHSIEDIDQMSKLVDVELRTVSIRRSKANEWLRAFFAVVNDSNRMFQRQASELDRTGSWNVRLHGAYYEVWFRRIDSQLFMSVHDKDLGETITGDSALARWMNTIRLQTKTMTFK